MKLVTTETNETFDSWLQKEFVTRDLRKLLLNASILIVPFEGLRDTQNPLMFPIGTEEILRYFQEKLPQGQIIDICISDADYQEFAFYSNYKRLGNFVVKEVVVSVFVSILSLYVYDRYIKEDNTKPQIEIIDKSTNTTINNHIHTLTDKKYLEPTHIEFSVTVVDTVGQSKNISYKGPASEMEVALKSLKEYEK